MNEMQIIIQKANTALQSPEDLKEATSILSMLNKQLDALQAHKEAKTQPINEALKKIREDYAPKERQLKDAIASLRSNITTYATLEEERTKALKGQVLKDKRTSPHTKIDKLSLIPSQEQSISTEEGSITFTTITRYVLKDHTTLTKEQASILLELNTTALKAYLKDPTNKLPKGIEAVQEKSLKNYR